MSGVDTASALYVGRIHHTRRAVRRHAFAYPAYHLLLNLDEVPALDRSLRGFGHNRPAVSSFQDRDHLGAVDAPLRLKLGRWLERQGASLGDGPVLLLTSLRVLGYVFNPASLYYCLDDDHTLRMVVVEVRNTFGETHCYLLRDLEPTAGGMVRASATKAFHVSPFFRVEGEYHFTLSLPAETLRVVVDYRRDGERQLTATLDERHRPLTSATLARALLLYPHVTAQTIALIHWQALRLWLKRVPWYAKPEPPPSLLEGGS